MDYLIGHLIGDYLFQNDWMAMNKKKPGWFGILACLIHSTIYTLSVCLCTGWIFLSSWPFIYSLVFLSHYPIDRTYIVGWYMKKFGAFKRIIDNPKVDFHHKTWAYLFVDNTVHLTLLWLIGRYAI